MVSSLPGFLLGLKEAGYTVIGTSVKKEAGKAPQTLERISEKTLGKAVALILGNEERGLAPDVAAACSDLVMIPGQGTVESLNVSAAAAVLIWELMGSRASSRRR
jgi:TrmH RNA methyltransferase